MTHLVSLRKFRIAVLMGLALPGLLLAQDQPRRGRKYTPPPPTAKITVTVIKATNGKPVENAAVVFHPMKEGKSEGNLELKSNEEGKVTIEVIPIGYTVRLQVIANGFETFGDDYPIPTDSKDIVVKLKRPDKQYSIYEKHADGQRGGNDSTPPPTTPPPSNPQ
ncbi:hypothetical protein [Silvibacterium acidisoli]|uniref:hypothetical protein n=1 Tax=Acidobacteriaceae bacterium ZG23-2 TaxID=2883246 RepID=UPI00406C9325